MDAENPGRRNVLPGFVVFQKVLAWTVCRSNIRQTTLARPVMAPAFPSHRTPEPCLGKSRRHDADAPGMEAVVGKLIRGSKSVQKYRCSLKTIDNNEK